MNQQSNQLEVFYRTNSLRHINTIRRIVGDVGKAEDIVQDAYVKAHIYRDKYDENRSGFNQWFNKILFNCLRDSIRNKNTFEAFDEDVVYDELNEPSNLVEHEISMVENIKHKEILTKIFVEGYKPKDLETMFGESRNNVDKILFRFKERVSIAHSLRCGK